MIIDELGPAPQEIIPHVPRALSPMVRRIPTEKSRINTYLIGIDEILVLNPGTDSKEHFEAIVGCGGDGLKWIASTSTNKDYAGGKNALAKKLGLTRKNLKHGDVLQSTEFKLSCFRSNDTKSNTKTSKSDKSNSSKNTGDSKTSSDELVFFLEEERVLFCNDLLSAEKSDPIYKVCVNLTKKLKPRRIAPAKGQIIEDFGLNLAGYLAKLQN